LLIIIIIINNNNNNNNKISEILTCVVPKRPVAFLIAQAISSSLSLLPQTKLSPIQSFLLQSPSNPSSQLMTLPSCSSSSPPPPLAAVGAEATSLAPGFRFHPTDEELVSYYLKRKVLGRPLKVDAIAEVDLYKIEPWDLPARSRLRSRDSQWYFFSRLDRKHSNRARTNRATNGGYWKTTGKDREVHHGPRVVGMKKTLVFHAGRAPKGDRTNWVMHEYRLGGDEVPQVFYPFPFFFFGHS
jgi:hypothetical protein